MKPVYILNSNIIASLGFTTGEVMDAVGRDITGIRLNDDPALYPSPVPLSQVATDRLEKDFNTLLTRGKKSIPAGSYTRLEKMMILSINDALHEFAELALSPGTLLVISTTKGNINLLEERYKTLFSHKRLFLWEMARIVRQFFGFVHTPLIVSNACISGVVALMSASRLIQAGLYDHAVVAGGDIASEFVISGFQSFQAMSPDPCRPFDANRAGLSLGEGCGTIVLSASPGLSAGSAIRVAGAATTNDANHISGPSRTGEELYCAVKRSMDQAGLTSQEIGYVSAHGTATPFNDEMESKALGLSRLEHVPVNSFKGYWGHTLGAAGVIESAAAVHSLKNNMLYRSAGFSTLGVPVPLNVIGERRETELNACLKIASGFGGCNAAIIYQKD